MVIMPNVISIAFLTKKKMLGKAPECSPIECPCPSCGAMGCLFGECPTPSPLIDIKCSGIRNSFSHFLHDTQKVPIGYHGRKMKKMRQGNLRNRRCGFSFFGNAPQVFMLCDMTCKDNKI
jgi:hypothetical protein